MAHGIESAQEQDVPTILSLVNRYADRNIMLPRTEESVRATLPDWLVVCEDDGAETSTFAGAACAYNIIHKPN